MLATPTPHIKAVPGDIAETVLLPGDPLRARLVAQEMFTDARQYNEVRGILGYTGYYKGKRVSVQGTGMGIPSISIYVNELIQGYGCRKLIRVGTCGSLSAEVRLREVVLAQAACTDSSFNRIRFHHHIDFAPIADFELLLSAYNVANRMGLPVRVGNILSTDTFYAESHIDTEQWHRYGIIAVEMEAAALYTLAAKFGCQALCVLTVSDIIPTHEATSADERQNNFLKMAEIALEAAL
ncbi:MAG: purine-nucleoside phosphorylase [Negativicutes bacterium]|nr:purine-nucleoside phosphorylase [Negativicutes bacterium]